MTAAAFEQPDRHPPDGRGLLDELQGQPTSLLTLGTMVLLILVVGELTGTLAMASMVAAFLAIGMVKLLGERRATLWHTASIGVIHLGVAMLIAGTA